MKRPPADRVRRAFARAATSYDAHAVLQREIAQRLIDHLRLTKLEPRRILDIGCGTGHFTRLLRRRYPRARIVALDLAMPMLDQARKKEPRRLPWRGVTRFVGGDAMRLPFAEASFDLVTSNLTMQWVSEPEAMLSEMRRVLAPGGLMLFSTFGRRTLIELRQTLAGIEPELAGLVLPFPDVTELGDALMRLPLQVTVTDADLFTLTYPDTMALLRDLKGLGASAAAIPGRGGRGLYGRRLIQELARRYPARHRTEDGRIRASFEALYGQAWHADGVVPARGMIPIRPLDVGGEGV